MRITKWPEIFESSLHILNSLQDAGFKAYFVGGSVRDYLLNLPVHDVDIATSAYPEEIKKIFPQTIDTGIQHGTVTVMDHGTSYELTTFRTESGYQDYRRPDKVTFVRSLKEDLQRRDFTINALAIAPDGEIIDEYEGLADLDSHVIRAVGRAQDRFTEDALRMMRAVRFQSQLDFEIETNTLTAIRENVELLKKISIERINTEFTKMLLGKNWQRGFEQFLKTGLALNCPEFSNQSQNLEKMLSLKNTRITSARSLWALVCQLLNIKDTRRFLTIWKESNQIKDDVQKINFLTVDIENSNYDVWDFYQIGEKYFADLVNVCDVRKIEIDTSQIKQIYATLPITNKKDLAINGDILLKELKIAPGPKLGKILLDIEKQVVYGKLENEKSELIKYCRKNYEVC